MKERIRIQRRYRDDIAGLEKRLGNLGELEGKHFSFSLQDFGKICERDSLRIVSYTGLINYVRKTFGMNITLYSNKTRKSD